MEKNFVIYESLQQALGEEQSKLQNVSLGLQNNMYNLIYSFY